MTLLKFIHEQLHGCHEVAWEVGSSLGSAATGAESGAVSWGFAICFATASKSSEVLAAVLADVSTNSILFLQCTSLDVAALLQHAFWVAFAPMSVPCSIFLALFY